MVSYILVKLLISKIKNPLEKQEKVQLISIEEKKNSANWSLSHSNAYETVKENTVDQSHTQVHYNSVNITNRFRAGLFTFYIGCTKGFHCDVSIHL
jgi:hypothetical protein